jgi:hypothetical protein
VRVTGSFYNLPQLVVLDALFGGGDSATARQEVRTLAARITEPNAASHEARAEQYADICIAELWRVRHGNPATATQSLARLRAGAQPQDSAGFHGGSPLLCAEVLAAELAFAGDTPARRAAAARLDSLMRTGPALFGADFGNIVVARLFAADGEYARALAALRRRPYYSLAGTFFLAPVLAEQGRVAFQLGDRPTAARAFRHYIALRDNADPELRDELARVKAELKAVE